MPCWCCAAKRTTLPERVRALQADGLRVELVPGWYPMPPRWALPFVPKIPAGHPGRAWLQRTPLGPPCGCWRVCGTCVHVEHNPRERYNAWRLVQARWLARRTDAIVGALKGAQCVAGVWISARPCACHSQWHPPGAFMPMPRRIRFVQRIPGIVMAARFARQRPCHLVAGGGPPAHPWAEAASAAGRWGQGQCAACRRAPGPNAGAGRPGDLPRALQRRTGVAQGTKSACCPPTTKACRCR